MKVEPNEFGFVTLKTTRESEAKFLRELYERGHILIVAKCLRNKNGTVFCDLAESFKPYFNNRPKRKSS